jgi:hypothetical protein
MTGESVRVASKNAVRSRGNAFDYRMPIPLVLIAPGLLGCSTQSLARSHALALIAEMSASPHIHEDGLASAMLSALGVPATTPVAPLAAYGAGIDTGNEYVLIADPVLLAADRDSVVLVTRIIDIEEAESAMLLSTLNEHFAEDGVRFVAPRADAWFIVMQHGPPTRVAATDVVRGRSVFTFLPKGDDARVLRRWQNEMQMLLHEHPVNARREKRGAMPVTGVWFWGGGALDEVDQLPRIVGTAKVSRFADIIVGVARKGGGTASSTDNRDTLHSMLEQTKAQGQAGTSIVVAVVDIDADESLTTFETKWLEPALQLLVDGNIGSLQVLANGNGVAAQWTATRPSWWQRLIPRSKAKPFAPPVVASS